MTTQERAQVWIGLAEVRQRAGAGVMLDRNAAITNALALALNEAEFRNAVAAALDALGFDLVELEESEPLEDRSRAYSLSDELLVLASEVRENGEPRFGSFHTWISER